MSSTDYDVLKSKAPPPGWTSFVDSIVALKDEHFPWIKDGRFHFETKDDVQTVLNWGFVNQEKLPPHAIKFYGTGEGFTMAVQMIHREWKDHQAVCEKLEKAREARAEKRAKVPADVKLERAEKRATEAINRILAELAELSGDASEVVETDYQKLLFIARRLTSLGGNLKHHASNLASLDGSTP